MRYLLLFPLGCAVALILFGLMSYMVAPPQNLSMDSAPPVQLSFLRQKQETGAERRERSLPPPPEQPVAPDSAMSASSQAQELSPPSVSVPAFSTDLSVTSLSGSGDILAGIGMGDSEVMPLVRPAANYPARALSRKIEGYVKARLTISAEGSVTGVEVIESEPPGVFEREAIRALYRYRFEPKVENGKAVGQTATQTIEFSLK